MVSHMMSGNPRFQIQNHVNLFVVVGFEGWLG